MTLHKFPATTTRLHTWVKMYVHKYAHQGSGAAARYLRESVPKQLHPQVVKTGDKILIAKRKKGQ
jgi:hypothetical protein